jgi:hypothetical protein
MKCCFGALSWISIFCLILPACGVKGKPMPPLTAPVLGRGEPNYSKATEKVKLKKKPLPSDWEESEDFPEEKEK